MLKKFQGNIRPVLDKLIREAFERSRTPFLRRYRYWNELVYTQNSGPLENLNELLGSHPFLFQDVVGIAPFVWLLMDYT